jgi:hypothetical protein
MWRLPLWPGYRKMLDSKVADLGSTGEPGAAGSITAALFLQEFAKAAPSWVHIDTAGGLGARAGWGGGLLHLGSGMLLVRALCCSFALLAHQLPEYTRTLLVKELRASSGVGPPVLGESLLGPDLC